MSSCCSRFITFQALGFEDVRNDNKFKLFKHGKCVYMFRVLDCGGARGEGLWERGLGHVRAQTVFLLFVSLSFLPRHQS